MNPSGARERPAVEPCPYGVPRAGWLLFAVLLLVGTIVLLHAGS